MSFTLRDASGALLTFVSRIVGGSHFPVHIVGTADGGGGYGAGIYRNLNVGRTGKIIKNSPGTVYGGYISNLSGHLRYVKLYDKATAPIETDVPIATFVVSPAETASPPSVYNLELPDFAGGLSFTSGIGIRATTGLADNDIVSPGISDIIVNILFR